MRSSSPSIVGSIPINLIFALPQKQKHGFLSHHRLLPAASSSSSPHPVSTAFKICRSQQTPRRRAAAKQQICEALRVAWDGVQVLRRRHFWLRRQRFMFYASLPSLEIALIIGYEYI
ncbi:hypothetical protein DM860_007218 [Cuscuta australis]|uniref:Uncharacterized protein n=1 Tax=Cuscuta australis TaxID=267555 RepID=A0A328E7A5_9ASTE|nr:hypothetical protein DM860_007218 [Cuscuta australis]